MVLITLPPRPDHGIELGEVEIHVGKDGGKVCPLLIEGACAMEKPTSA
jgi:hypothetical protein